MNSTESGAKGGQSTLERYGREHYSEIAALRKNRTPWNLGKNDGWVDKRGYRWLYVVENGKKRAMREHRYVMELSIGRKLTSEEVVHHINGARSDNRIENLRIEDWGQHTSNHHTGRKRPEHEKKTLEILANYREETRRLKSVNESLFEACKAALTCYWDDSAYDSRVRENIMAAVKLAEAGQ